MGNKERAMEYVIVECNESRKVLVDEQENGQTGETLRISAGKHTFSLQGDLNFRPDKVTKKIKGTSAITPEIIKFEV